MFVEASSLDCMMFLKASSHGFKRSGAAAEGAGEVGEAQPPPPPPHQATSNSG